MIHSLNVIQCRLQQRDHLVAILPLVVHTLDVKNYLVDQLVHVLLVTLVRHQHVVQNVPSILNVQHHLLVSGNVVKILVLAHVEWMLIVMY